MPGKEESLLARRLSPDVSVARVSWGSIQSLLRLPTRCVGLCQVVGGGREERALLAAAAGAQGPFVRLDRQALDMCGGLLRGWDPGALPTPSPRVGLTLTLCVSGGREPAYPPRGLALAAVEARAACPAVVGEASQVGAAFLCGAGVCRVGSGRNPGHRDGLGHSFLLFFCFILRTPIPAPSPPPQEPGSHL